MKKITIELTFEQFDNLTFILNKVSFEAKYFAEHTHNDGYAYQSYMDEHQKAQALVDDLYTQKYSMKEA